MTEGLLVAVEGIDHSGKTTLVTGLTAALSVDGMRVVSRTEPSRGPIGVFFRHLALDAGLPPVAAALLSAADRHEQQAAIRRELASHDVVLCDRYYLSGLAYHHADGFDPEVYQALNVGVRRPDVYLYLTLPLAVATARGGAPADRWEQPTFAARVPDSYRHCLEVIRRLDRAHVVPIDAARPPALVLADAVVAIQSLLGERKAA